MTHYIHPTLPDSSEADRRLRTAAIEWRTTFDAIHDAVALLDTDYHVLRCNKAMSELLGIPFSQIIGQRCHCLMHKLSHPHPDCPFQRTLETGERHTMVLRLGERWMRVSTDPVMDESGQTVGIAHIVTDITERKVAQDRLQSSLSEKEVLLREIHHRVKNNLQIISSLLNLQADEIDDDKARRAFQDSQERIRSMALVHESLYRSEDLAQVNMAEYVIEQVEHLGQAYRLQDSPRLEVSVEPILLSIDRAIPCGLIVNELVSNAFKHAFPFQVPTPHDKWIRCKIASCPATDRQGSPMLRVTVSDNGVGLPPHVDPATSTSLGLQLVSILTRQLGGIWTTTLGHGTRFEVTFPERIVS